MEGPPCHLHVEAKTTERCSHPPTQPHTCLRGGWQGAGQPLRGPQDLGPHALPSGPASLPRVNLEAPCHSSVPQQLQSIWPHTRPGCPAWRVHPRPVVPPFACVLSHPVSRGDLALEAPLLLLLPGSVTSPSSWPHDSSCPPLTRAGSVPSRRHRERQA